MWTWKGSCVRWKATLCASLEVWQLLFECWRIRVTVNPYVDSHLCHVTLESAERTAKSDTVRERERTRDCRSLRSRSHGVWFSVFGSTELCETLARAVRFNGPRLTLVPVSKHSLQKDEENTFRGRRRVTMSAQFGQVAAKASN